MRNVQLSPSELCMHVVGGGPKLGKGQGIPMGGLGHTFSLRSHNKSWAMQVAHEDPITSYKKYIHTTWCSRRPFLHRAAAKEFQKLFEQSRRLWWPCNVSKPQAAAFKKSLSMEKYIFCAVLNVKILGDSQLNSSYSRNLLRVIEFANSFQSSFFTMHTGAKYFLKAIFKVSESLNVVVCPSVRWSLLSS